MPSQLGAMGPMPTVGMGDVDPMPSPGMGDDPLILHVGCGIVPGEER